MTKLTPGRLSGFWGMEAHTAEELHAWADALEKEAADPASDDDPRWSLRWAKKIRWLAEKKERAMEHKAAQDKSDRSG